MADGGAQGGMMRTSGSGCQSQVQSHPRLDGNESTGLPLPEQATNQLVEVGGIQRTLPDDVIKEILKRLPWTSQCRFRCVCSKWRRLLSPKFSAQLLTPPRASCTFLSSWGEREALFFCHGEWKWFHVPHVALHSTGWSVEDVHEGFVCYETWLEYDRSPSSEATLAVSNPLLSSLQILPPKPHFPLEESRGWCITKLWVDRQTGTFKVIVLVGDSSITEIFDSSTSQWELFDTPDFLMAFESNRVELFFWHNIAYLHCWEEAEGDCFHELRFNEDMEPRILALDIESKTWRSIDAQFPGRNCYPMQYKFIVHKEEVILLQICLLPRIEDISMWKLLDKPSAASELSFSSWEKIRVISEMPTPNLCINTYRHIHYDDEYIFFVLDGNDAPKDEQVPMYAKYTFATRAWSLTPCPNTIRWSCRNKASCRSFEWKPSLDMEVKLHDTPASLS